jgi:hypothetical protein
MDIFALLHITVKNLIFFKRVLSFSFMPSLHNDTFFVQKIYDLLQEWRIDKNVFSITLNNASTNDLCVKKLKLKLNIKNSLLYEDEFFHMHCCAHIYIFTYSRKGRRDSNL